MILDTNVFSEAIKPSPNEVVSRWLDECDVNSLYVTSINLYELLFGMEIMPSGNRQDEFKLLLTDVLTRRIGKRILSFDAAAAREHALRAANARKRGLTVSLADGQIASIAAVHGFPVATRDEQPFKIMGVKVINPWKLQ